ncbi:MAG TPA: PhnD/SsuA/transferrin family substrate-binding protein [Candidatus Binatia bacterium]|jgi:phosphonate transport system substrate-binding protein
MNPLKLSSCMGDNAADFCRAAAVYLETRLSTPVAFVDQGSWQERERLFDAGLIHICWLCGWPYVLKADRRADIELLGAPLPAGERYRDRPIYFSDIVVCRDSAFHSFADLHRSRWTYNEPLSHSGYNLVRWHLASLGVTRGFFGSVVESGAHSRSLRMVLDGTVDGAAIDSMVLEWELGHKPQLAGKIRVVGTLGPSPVPPWAISKKVPAETRATIRAELLAMHERKEGQAILARGRLTRFAAVLDGDYNAIREMAELAVDVSL